MYGCTGSIVVVVLVEEVVEEVDEVDEIDEVDDEETDEVDDKDEMEETDVEVVPLTETDAVTTATCCVRTLLALKGVVYCIQIFPEKGTPVALYCERGQVKLTFAMPPEVSTIFDCGAMKWVGMVEPLVQFRPVRVMVVPSWPIVTDRVPVVPRIGFWHSKGVEDRQVLGSEGANTPNWNRPASTTAIMSIAQP
jgi:hypothetical protein